MLPSGNRKQLTGQVKYLPIDNTSSLVFFFIYCFVINHFSLWLTYNLISIYSQWTEEDEIADYKKNQEWMDECMDGMFEKWYDKIEEESAEDKRKVHYF